MLILPVPKDSFKLAMQHFDQQCFTCSWHESGSSNVHLFVYPISSSYTILRPAIRVYANGSETKFELRSSDGMQDLNDGVRFSSPGILLIQPDCPPDASIIITIVGDKMYDIYPPICEDEDPKYKVVPVHRFWNVKGGYHAYLTDPDEVEKMRKEHWREWYDMGVCFYALLLDEEQP